MWECIKEPTDLLILRDWLLDTNAPDKVIERLEKLIEDKSFPQEFYENYVTLPIFIWYPANEWNYNEPSDIKEIPRFFQGMTYIDFDTLEDALKYYCYFIP